MATKINTLNPQFFGNIPSQKPHFRPTSITVITSSYNDRESTPISTKTQTQVPKLVPNYEVSFKTLGACKLGVSRYPDFEYNAEGGNGVGKGARNESNDDVWVSFDLSTLYVPPLSSATTKFLGLPLPPLLKIDILPQLFEGTIGRESGKVDLQFKAKFCFSVGTIYKAPPLIVETVLTSEESSGTIRRGKGERLNKDGKCRLVGVARVSPIDDFFMNTFLQLPTECLADLNAIISFTS